MALPQSALSELLDAIRAGGSEDVLREAMTLVLWALPTRSTQPSGWIGMPRRSCEVGDPHDEPIVTVRAIQRGRPASMTCARHDQS